MSSLIPDSTLEWLLEPDNPPVRYLTLTDLLGRPPSDPEVRETRSRLGQYGPTRTILEQFDQFRNDCKAEAYWKYTGMYWQLIFLGQFRADGQDPRVRELVEKMIETRNWVLIKQGGQCLTANVLLALILLGYAEHPVVREAAVGLAKRLLTDGGIDCEVMEYSLLPFCYMAQPKLLLCFGADAGLRKQPSVAAAIQLLARNLLAHQVFVYVPGNRNGWHKILELKPSKAELGGATVKSWMQKQKDQFLAEKGPGQPMEKPGWLKFGFPLHYNSDVLETLYALALCRVPADESLQKPLQVLRQKMTPEGRWRLENSLNGKMRVDVEEVGKPSKWLTYRAWYALKHFGVVKSQTKVTQAAQARRSP